MSTIFESVMREISGRFVAESEMNLLCPISGSSKILCSNGRVDVNYARLLKGRSSSEQAKKNERK